MRQIGPAKNSSMRYTITFLQLLFTCRMADARIGDEEAIEIGLKLGRSALGKIGLEV